jgi:hypothetical protein
VWRKPCGVSPGAIGSQQASARRAALRPRTGTPGHGSASLDDGYRAEPARGRIVAVHVTLWYFVDCPNWRLAEQRLGQALDEIGLADARISLALVGGEAEAAAVGFAGSPTFTVDGVDLFDPPASVGTMACRVYHTPAGLAGVPRVADLVTTLTKKVTR